jgi:hypothetical protein
MKYCKSYILSNPNIMNISSDKKEGKNKDEKENDKKCHNVGT